MAEDCDRFASRWRGTRVDANVAPSLTALRRGPDKLLVPTGRDTCMHRSAAEDLITRYRTLIPDSLRIAVWYEGDEYEVLHAEDAIEEQYSPEEFTEKVKQLVVEGLSDPPGQEPFRLFGEMEVVVRRFEKAVMLHFPVDEFTGLAVTMDRNEATSVDTLANVGVDEFQSASPPQ